MSRKQKLRFFQISLLIFGLFIIYFTYYGDKKDAKQTIVPPQVQDRIKKQIENQPEGYEVFKDIKYSNLDLSGNRYILKSKQAYSKSDEQEIVNLISVEAIFYFKDNTILKVISDYGIYNNKTLDMNFTENIKATYQDSVLYAQKAEYSNSNSNLTISKNVKLEDNRGTMFADKLFFDIKKQTLNVTALENSNINANIKIK